MSLQMVCNFFRLVFLLSMCIGISNAESGNIETRNDQDELLPIVKILQGTLQGITLMSRYNRSISSFLGIPYAQPPIENLRFSSPVPAEAWNGTFNASVDGSPCLQVGNIGEEDCLYLNVYTPQLPESDNSSLLPVMVFIPGGGFEAGHGGSTMYGPDLLLDADLLLVSINYRLGPLGFLSTGDEVAPGNWGLKDQVLALQWVQKNIAFFGGDPDQVTIFGESAGGASVQLLTLSDSTIGLFHKFISQSGAAWAYWVHQPRSSYPNLALKLGEFLDCPTNTSSYLVGCLRERSAAEIINTRWQFYEWTVFPLFIWGPTDEPDIDGAFLTDTPANLLAAGKIRDLPSITGIVKDEGIMFGPGFPESEGFSTFLDNFDYLLPFVLQYSDHVEDVTSFTASLKEFYFNNDLTINRTELWSNCVDLVSDTFFIYPVYNALQKQLAFAKNPSFFYSFEYDGVFNLSDILGVYDIVLSGRVTHGEDLLYLFPLEGLLPGISIETPSETDFHMMDVMVQLWTSFAINGTPTTMSTISNTTWSAYSSEDNYLRIGSGSDGSLDLRYNFLQERMQFWNNLTATGSGNIPNISPFLSSILIILIAYPEIFY